VKKVLGWAITALIAIVVIGAIGGGGSKKKSDPASNTTAPTSASTDVKDANSVDQNTRAFVGKVRNCEIVLALASADLKSSSPTDIKAASDLTDARDTCDRARSDLLQLDTDHFDDQASVAWDGVDRVKSGLNALLNYLDSSAPSKLVEGRNKIQAGQQEINQGVRQINHRRHVYGLKSLKLV
jgi:hypothetical protein